MLINPCKDNLENFSLADHCAQRFFNQPTHIVINKNQGKVTQSVLAISTAVLSLQTDSEIESAIIDHPAVLLPKETPPSTMTVNPGTLFRPSPGQCFN